MNIFAFSSPFTFSSSLTFCYAVKMFYYSITYSCFLEATLSPAYVATRCRKSLRQKENLNLLNTRNRSIASDTKWTANNALAGHVFNCFMRAWHNRKPFESFPFWRTQTKFALSTDAQMWNWTPTHTPSHTHMMRRTAQYRTGQCRTGQTEKMDRKHVHGHCHCGCLIVVVFVVAAAAAENCFLRRTNPYKGEGCLQQKVRGYAQ